MFNKLKEIRNGLNAKFFEREEVVEALLIALLSRQHLLLIGPAGTAKSALSTQLAKIVEGVGYFQWLLTRFTTPEELFGPLSLKELEKGIYKRNTGGKMPEAHLVFADEIFKSSSAILNSLLTLINERIFYNNGSPTPVPLMTIVGASNEYPEDEENLEALFDRFLLRFELSYIGEEQHFMAMLKGEGQDVKLPSLSLTELQQLQFYCEMVSIPKEAYQTLFVIRQKLKDEGVHPSDRRFRQSLQLLQAKALVNGRQEVKVEDLLLLSHVLWESPDQKEIVTQIVKENAQDGVSSRLEEIKIEFEEITKNAQADNSTDISLEATEKLKNLERQLKNLFQRNPDREADIAPVMNKVRDRKNEIANAVLEV